MCFHFAFCPFSFLSGLKGKGGQWHNKPFHNIFCSWRCDLRLGVGSMQGLDLCSVFFFLSWLFFPHPVFILENNGIMSHFLKSWLLCELLSCFLFITIKVNIKTDCYLLNLKIIRALNQIILLLGSCLLLLRTMEKGVRNFFIKPLLVVQVDLVLVRIRRGETVKKERYISIDIFFHEQN